MFAALIQEGEPAAQEFGSCLAVRIANAATFNFLLNFGGVGLGGPCVGKVFCPLPVLSVGTPARRQVISDFSAANKRSPSFLG
jgi:hypothetical protein